MKKFLFSFGMVVFTAGVMLGHNPEKKKNNVTDPNTKDTAKPNATATVTPIPKANTSAQTNNSAVKTKVTIPVKKKEADYELKAPSIFTFTVLNTYFEMPAKK